jgi:sec-independent protein translocase protein TatA
LSLYFFKKKLKNWDSKFDIFVSKKKTEIMFGIGGGELIFIMFIVLMLFGSDKVPEIARTMGKAMAQLKNATNDIKNEIQKEADASGFDQKTLTDLTGNITSEINKAKDNLLGDTTAQVNKVAGEIDEITGPIKRQM